MKYTSINAGRVEIQDCLTTLENKSCRKRPVESILIKVSRSKKNLHYFPKKIPQKWIKALRASGWAQRAHLMELKTAVLRRS